MAHRVISCIFSNICYSVGLSSFKRLDPNCWYSWGHSIGMTLLEEECHCGKVMRLKSHSLFSVQSLRAFCWDFKIGILNLPYIHLLYIQFFNCHISLLPHFVITVVIDSILSRTTKSIFLL